MDKSNDEESWYNSKRQKTNEIQHWSNNVVPNERNDCSNANVTTDVVPTNTVVDDAAYIEQVTQYLNTLVRDNCITIESTTVDGKLKFSIQLNEPRWFKELDGETKQLIIHNLQRMYTSKIKQILRECNDDLC